MSSPRSIRDHVIVDGSNIATEGRTLPSLTQLDEAVRAFLDEYPGTLVTVVVDATFQHRIDTKERQLYEEAVLAGEIVAPPAGAIGRGDAFIAAAAAKADATVLSNDSFQELHGDHPWLFDEGRLVGGKPVDGVGWVFVPRTPVRGSVSRKSQREARSGRGRKGRAKPSSETERAKVAEAIEAEVEARRSRGSAPPDADGAGPAKGKGRAASKSRSGTQEKVAAADDKQAGGTKRKRRGAGAADRPSGAKAADSSDSAAKGGRSRRSGKAPEAINEPGPFLSFVSSHPVGTQVDGVVDRFSSHGAYVVIDEAQCYVPLKSMADPPPRSAREVLTVGEVMTFVVDAFDTPRRSIDLALPGHEQTGSPVGQPTPEEGTDMAPAKKRTAKKAVKKKAPAKRAAAKKAPAKKKAVARKAAAKKKAPAKKKAVAKKAPAKKKAGAKKAAAKKKAPTKKRAAAKKAAARKRG